MSAPYVPQTRAAEVIAQATDSRFWSLSPPMPVRSCHMPLATVLIFEETGHVRMSLMEALVAQGFRPVHPASAIMRDTMGFMALCEPDEGWSRVRLEIHDRLVDK